MYSDAIQHVALNRHTLPGLSRNRIKEGNKGQEFSLTESLEAVES